MKTKMWSFVGNRKRTKYYKQTEMKYMAIPDDIYSLQNNLKNKLNATFWSIVKLF